jgi:hypothetical protein
MQDNILDYDVSYADETRVQVLNELERKAEQQSFMWCFAGGNTTKFSIIFQYSPTRNHSIPLEFFGNDYAGYLHCDGYSAYETMAKKNKVILVGCMLHARRKFMDIAKANLNHELGLSHQAIKFFKKLTKIEHDIKNNKFDEKRTKSYRKQHTIPILDEFKIWLDKNIQLVPPRFPIGAAIQYTLNQWPKLIKYLEDGRLEWSNNFSERIMKAFATGRKNWLFSNSVKGAEASSIIYSLVVTCQHHKIDVFRYFRYILQNIPNCANVEELEKLLPYNVNLKSI